MSRLEAGHGVVLHPGTHEAWVVHSFSVSPTGTWVESAAAAGRSWWAPCMWRALGIGTLAGGSVVIHARPGGEAMPAAIGVLDGVMQPPSDALVAHFPGPPRGAWGNVHHFCARLLAFGSPADVRGTASPWAS